MSNSKERAIKFNPEMIRAILDGRKTQTRRRMKVQPTPAASGLPERYDYEDKHCFMRNITIEDMNKLGLIVPYTARYKVGDLVYVEGTNPAIWLKITGIKVERLHDITSNDIKAEGVSYTVDYYCDLFEQWQKLWISIYGKESFDNNDFVLTYTFERINHE